MKFIAPNIKHISPESLYVPMHEQARCRKLSPRNINKQLSYTRIDDVFYRKCCKDGICPIFYDGCNPFYTFEQFCIDNKIDINNEKEYDVALEVFDAAHWDRGEHGYEMYNEIDFYNSYQRMFYENIYELTYDNFINCLFKLLFKLANAERINRLHHEFSTDCKIEDALLRQILNQFNSSLVECIEENNKFIYKIRPACDVEATDEIQSQEYVYYVTFKGNLDKILKYGLDVSYYDYSKMHFFTDGVDLKEKIYNFIIKQRELIRLVKNDDFDLTPIVIKVDMNRQHSLMKFFKDDLAYYSQEWISPASFVAVSELKYFI